MLDQILVPFLDIQLLILIALGTLFGVVKGLLPGLSVTMAVTLLVSLTYTWETIPAIVTMIAVFYGGVYGGARSSILINVPGSASSLAHTFDGYPLTKRGEAGVAIGITTIYAVIGGAIGLLCLGVAAPFLGELALGFAARDYFLIMFLGLLLVGGLSEGSMAKAIFVAGVGVTLGMVGMDSLTGVERFTFGNLELKSGINYIACMLGLFGLSEVLIQLHNLGKTKADVIIGKVLPPLIYLIKFLPLTIRTAIIGVVVGILPGAGGEISSLLAYDHAKKTVKNPTRPFGKGAYEGLVAPEVAVMSTNGGAMIPMLTLGIPGDAVTAVLIGAMTIHGLKPGPMLMVETPELFWIILGAALVSLIFIVIWGLSAISFFARVILIPKYVLMPIIVFFTVIGSYGINNSVADVYWMIVFGVIGYLLRLYKFPTGPMVLGIILGPQMDVYLRRAIITEEGSIWGFVSSLFIHPISLILTLFVLFTLFSQTALYKKVKGQLLQKFSKKSADV
ncbi:tripartite tricarboxylate transporter permease [Brevibacillus sp. AY1]|uniref:tripartite tricarboxylate transporter permease n=1 Tax=Brevibacillus sp. AY1 TaxID=2807621 RepID=UPI002456379B|nr:tripartite tricarboxylate transporter permease [Brevibacillus sp. AY1]MDH4616922.1 tripartite tricarboxylate transporter permease [Brevibacillus sp. AY1]